MQITQKTINDAIKKRFIKPLDAGCKYNINKLNNDRK